MSAGNFRQYYERLSDSEFAQIVAEKQELLPEAVEALDQEIQRRHFKKPEAPEWFRQPDSEEHVESLEDYEEYRSLLERKKAFGRYWYLLAMGPFVIGLMLGRTHSRTR
jgi:hypothetical protein